MENLILKEIAKNIEIISIKTEKIDNQTKKMNTQLLQETMQKFFDIIIENNDRHENRIKSQTTNLQKLKLYFEGFKNGFPLITKQHLIIKGVLKFHVYLYTLFICILITTSIYILNNFKDTTNYKKAWVELMSLEHSKENTKMLNTILENNKD